MNRHGRLKRKTPLKSKSRLKRTRLKQRGRNSAKKRRRDFGSHAELVRRMPCLVCGRTPSDPHHEPPRSRGGKAENLVPLCRKHHRQRHALGSAAIFSHYFHIDLEVEALSIWRKAWRQ